LTMKNEKQGMNTTHSRSKPHLGLSNIKPFSQISSVREPNTSRHTTVRSSFNYNQSAADLNQNQSRREVFHKKRSSQGSYSSFMDMYQHRKENQTQMSKTGYQKYTRTSELEDDHEDAIPEEAENLENETASANLKQYNTEILTNDRVAVIGKKRKLQKLYPYKKKTITLSSNHVPKSMTLKKPMTSKNQDSATMKKPQSRGIYHQKDISRMQNAHINRMSMNTARTKTGSFLNLRTEGDSINQTYCEGMFELFCNNSDKLFR